MQRMTQQATRMDGRDWGFLVFLSVLWGGSFFFAGVAVKDLPPLTIVMVRVGLAALLLVPVLWMMGHRLPRAWADWRPFMVMGILNNVIPFSLIVTGQTMIASGTASIINAMTPVFAVLILAAFAEETLTRNRIAGVLAGFVGVLILRSGDAALSGEQTLGIVLCLGSTVSYGFAALWGRRQLGGVPPIKSATCQLLCSSLIMVSLAAAFEQFWTLPVPSLATWASLLCLAALATALAYLVFFQILVRSGASNVMLVTLLVPVSAIALGVMVLGEPLRMQEIIGALVICSALLIIDGRVFGRLAR